MAGKIQGADVKTEAELITAGANKTFLIRDTQIYVTATGINKTLDDAITDGDIGSGGGGGSASAIRLNTPNGFGSTNTKIRRFTNVQSTFGSDITYADTSANGTSITINTTGIYAFSYQEEGNTGAPLFGLSLNSATLTTDVNSLTNAEILNLSNVGTGNDRQTLSWIGKLSAGDVVRPHTNQAGGAFVSANIGNLTIAGPLAEGMTSIAAKYSATTLTNSIPNTSSPTIFDCPTQVYDTHSAVTTGSNWKFTVPTNGGGKYRVNVLATLDGYAWATGNYLITDVHVNGSSTSSIQWHGMQASFTGQLSVGGSTAVQVVAGDEISVCFLSSRTAGSITALEAVATRNHIEIERISA